MVDENYSTAEVSKKKLQPLVHGDYDSVYPFLRLRFHYRDRGSRDSLLDGSAYLTDSRYPDCTWSDSGHVLAQCPGFISDQGGGI